MITVQRLLKSIEGIAKTLNWESKPNPDPAIINYEGRGDGWVLLISKMEMGAGNDPFYGGAISSPTRGLLVVIPADLAHKIFNIAQTQWVN